MQNKKITAHNTAQTTTAIGARGLAFR